MAIDDKIRIKKQQCDITTNISALWSGEIDKYEYFTEEEILTSDPF